MLHPVCQMTASVGRQTTLFGRDCQVAVPRAKFAVSNRMLLNIAVVSKLLKIRAILMSFMYT